MLASGDIHNNLAEGAVRVAEHRAIDDWSLLSSDITVLPHRDAVPLDMPDVTAEAQRRIEEEEEAAAGEALEPEGEVDTSFRPEEFQQGAKPVPADRLETGETQPRLPGDVGDVRETEVATPQLEAPFSLTSETVPPAVKQTTLFQALFAGEPAPVATLSGNELGEGLDDVKELRRVAIDYYQRELQNGIRSVERPGFGVVEFRRKGANTSKPTAPTRGNCVCCRPSPRSSSMGNTSVAKNRGTRAQTSSRFIDSKRRCDWVQRPCIRRCWLARIDSATSSTISTSYTKRPR